MGAWASAVVMQVENSGVPIKFEETKIFGT